MPTSQLHSTYTSRVAESVNASGARRDLLRLEIESEVDQDFIAREAGDSPMTPEQAELHRAVRERRGDHFYEDLLFTLTHTRFAGARARQLWERLLLHKRGMSAALGRNVGIAVAALDYLMNVRGELHHPVLLSERQVASFAGLGTRDSMTGLLNHASFYDVLHAECKRAHRYGRSLSVVMIDVDHFKQFNDEHGHQAGDAALQRVARVVEEHVREVDAACRYGGEEFAIVAPDTSQEAAHELAERLRSKIKRGLAAEGITVSLGVATLPDDAMTGELLVRAADEALYQAKALGRDRTIRARPRPNGGKNNET